MERVHETIYQTSERLKEMSFLKKVFSQVKDETLFHLDNVRLNLSEYC